MDWEVLVEERVIDDLKWLGRKQGRLILEEAIERLQQNPLLESKNMKTLRTNIVAARELRLMGRYRVLFSVDEQKHSVSIVLAGEKRGASLFVRGEEFVDHESDPSK